MFSILFYFTSLFLVALWSLLAAYFPLSSFASLILTSYFSSVHPPVRQQQFHSFLLSSRNVAVSASRLTSLPPIRCLKLCNIHIYHRQQVSASTNSRFCCHDSKFHAAIFSFPCWRWPVDLTGSCCDPELPLLACLSLHTSLWWLVRTNLQPSSLASLIPDCFLVLLRGWDVCPGLELVRQTVLWKSSLGGFPTSAEAGLVFMLGRVIRLLSRIVSGLFWKTGFVLQLDQLLHHESLHLSRMWTISLKAFQG